MITEVPEPWLRNNEMYINPIENMKNILCYTPSYSMHSYFNIMDENPCDIYWLGEDCLKTEVGHSPLCLQLQTNKKK